ncbi:hypothetical protein KP79_PYT18020 [Mizuhopecten yessoensis]|uniref:Uncharacterized protein n=1 Tax=Mizuhopecten yessoensis TaxID=6573 RepID=A0A210R1G1_MIZYE|nr:hypothetical protein KP79_PYT18020 [Mizuhopecten yessoensis]
MGDDWKEVRLFYHNTWDKVAIEKSGLLERSKQNTKGWHTLADTGEATPPGVWLSLTLLDGQLPSFSPEEYGPDRVIINSLRVFDMVHGPVLYVGKERYSKQGFKLIRLFLARSSDLQSIQWCTRNKLEKVPVADNNYLCWNPVLNKWSTMSEPNTMVEVFVPYDIDLTNCRWQKVGCV